MSFFAQSYFVPDTVVSGYVLENQDAPSRIYSQYRNKEKAVAWFSIVYKMAAQIASVSELVRVSYSLDFATGEMLDTLGRIVVVPRNVTGYVPLNPGIFAVAGDDPAECGDDSKMFANLSVDQDSQMSDDLYRLIIKSKIIKNNSTTTTEDILRGANFLLPNADTLRVTDGEDMSFSIEFYGNITPLERWALVTLDLIPKPQGVRFNGFLEGYKYVQFGDSTQQFGDKYAEFTGFIGV